MTGANLGPSVAGRFCTARELARPHPSPATARRSGLRANPNASATSSAAETTRATPRTACSSVSCALAAKRPASKAWWWRSHRLRCLLRCPLPVHCLPAAGVLSALGARQWPGSWQGYSGVNVGVGGWVLPACVAAGLPAAAPPAGRRAGCWLLAQTVTLSGCHHHPGNLVQKLSASECYLAALPPSFPLSCCMPRSKRVGLCCRSPRQLLRSFQRADGFPDPWPVFIAHILLLPPTTCGLPTPFSTSFLAHRSRLGVLWVLWVRLSGCRNVGGEV